MGFISHNDVCVTHTCLFFLYDVTQRDNNNGRLWALLQTLPISKSIFYQQSGSRLVLSKGANF